jgi:hypothetical protein
MTPEMFRPLDPDAEQEFRAWARANWGPGDDINPVWHPVVRDECRAIEDEFTRAIIDAAIGRQPHEPYRGSIDYIVADAASGLRLDGAPNDYLVSLGRGHATLYQGIWFYRTPDDADGTLYRSVVVLPRRALCIGEGCDRTHPGIEAGHVYVCPEHVADVLGDGPEDEPKIGVDMSTGDVVLSSHQAGPPVTSRTRAVSRRKEPDMAEKKARPMTRRERIASGRTVVKDGITSILAGTASADDVLADVAAVVPEAVESESMGPVVNDDGTPTDVTVEMLTGRKPAKAEAVAEAPGVPAGSVFITLAERDRIRAEGSKALIGRIEAGVLTRPSGKPAPKFTQDEVEPRYYRNFLLAVSLTDAMRQGVVTVEADASWSWANARTATIVEESAPGAPALPRPRRVKAEPAVDTVKVIRVRQAKATLDAIETLPGPEYVKAIGTPAAQAALETVGQPESRFADADE